VARTPLWPTRFAVYASPQVVHACHRFLPITALSALGATLATGGWLALTRNRFRSLSRPGLAPGKKRQASLGAPRPDPLRWRSSPPPQQATRYIGLEFDRTAADRAVLNVALAAGGAVHQGSELLTAVGTFNPWRISTGTGATRDALEHYRQAVNLNPAIALKKSQRHGTAHRGTRAEPGDRPTPSAVKEYSDADRGCWAWMVPRALG